MNVNWTIIIISQNIHVLNHYAVYLNGIHFLCQIYFNKKKQRNTWINKCYALSVQKQWSWVMLGNQIHYTSVGLLVVRNDFEWTKTAYGKRMKDDSNFRHIGQLISKIVHIWEACSHSRQGRANDCEILLTFLFAFFLTRTHPNYWN